MDEQQRAEWFGWHDQASVTADLAKQFIANTEIVCAVWFDEKAPDGVGGIMIIKGFLQIARQVAADSDAVAAINSIPCSCYEEAVAVRNTFGDGERGYQLMESLTKGGSC